MRMTHDEALAVIRRTRLVAILRGVPLEKAEPVISALIAGGVRALEFTFDHDQPDYLAANAAKIRLAAERCGEGIAVGCGTALSTEEVEAAHAAGACLAITPNVNEEVIRRARALRMVAMPGALTPTEIERAWRAGADIVKLFPAGEMGIGYIKAVRGPLAHIPMSAVGGVKPENVRDFLNAGVSGFGVGGQLVQKAAVEACDWAAVERRAREFTDAIAAWEAER